MMVQEQSGWSYPDALCICSFVLFTFYAIRYTMDQANEKHSHSCKNAGFLTNPQASLPNRIQEILDLLPLIQTKQTLVVAVSGGSDSLCMLHLLSILLPKIRRIVVYVDHGLRPDETPAESNRVKSSAEICGADFRHVSVNVNAFRNKHGLSTEEAARILRYQELESIRSENNGSCICVGHTADDQAEEVLLRLIRGSGSKGLSGMELCNGRIIRPLLFESKATLRSWLSEKNIPFCEDSSNNDTRFLRNRIRLNLLPTLEKHYNPSIRKALIRTASILHEDDTLLQEIMERAYLRLVHTTKSTCPDGSPADTLSLDLPQFMQEPLSIKRRIVEQICIILQTQISFQKIELILDLACKSNNRELHLSGGLRAIKQEDTIIFQYPLGRSPHRHSVSVTAEFLPIEILTPDRYPVPELDHELFIQELSTLPQSAPSERLFIDPEKTSLPLILRPCQPEDIFHPLGAPGRKKVSRFLADQKIPAHKRSRQPVLVSGNTIVALPALRIDHSFRIQPTTKCIWQLEWRPLSSSKKLLKSI